MSDYLERYGAALDAAAARLVAGERPRRRARPLVSALAAVVAVAAVLVAVVTGGGATVEREAAPPQAPAWSPQIGDDRRGRGTVATTPPPDEQLAIMGVLRREQTAADRGAESRNGLTFVDRSKAGVRTDYVRRLEAGGVEAALIPVERFNVGMEKLAAKAPEALKAAYAEQRDGLCLWVPDPVDGGGLGCLTTENLQRGLGAASSSAPGRRVFYGLVPDAVAEVVIDLRNGEEITAVPEENFYAHLATDGPSFADRTRWLDGEGRVISDYPPPPPAGP